MKKIICIVFLFSGACRLNAQDLEVTKAFIYANQFDKGKDGIDKFIAAKPANATNPEAIYLKAYVYNAMARQATTTLEQGIALNRESFSSIKRYRELDPKEKFTKEENNATVYNDYFVFDDLAVKAYNAKNYDVSYSCFKDMLNVHDYIYSNKLLGQKGLSLSAVDTEVVWNLAVLGGELKDSNAVTDYYKMIVDAGIKDQKYLVAYEQLVLKYHKQNDQTLFAQYLEKGKAAFPEDSFWQEIDIVNATQGATGENLFKKYDELTARYPTNYTVWFYYGNDLNKYVYADENKAIDMTAYKAKVPELFKKAIAINSTPDANMLLANFYYNNSFDLSEAAGKIKGVKPEDVKKKNDLNNASKKSLEDCLPYAMAAADLYSKQTKLKMTEKTNFRLAYDMLSEVYRVKGDKVKSAEFKAKKDAIL